MVEAVSKNKLASWYRSTAIQHIRPVDIQELTGKRYWEKWDRVTETNLHKIARGFFERVWQVESPLADCLLFDTTNYSFQEKFFGVILHMLVLSHHKSRRGA
jgi:hypothetical protein